MAVTIQIAEPGGEARRVDARRDDEILEIHRSGRCNQGAWAVRADLDCRIWKVWFLHRVKVIRVRAAANGPIEPCNPRADGFI